MEKCDVVVVLVAQVVGLAKRQLLLGGQTDSFIPCGHASR
jgi:hypothetical protein